MDTGNKDKKEPKFLKQQKQMVFTGHQGQAASTPRGSAEINPDLSVASNDSQLPGFMAMCVHTNTSRLWS